jgi:hypothetical protein
MENESKCALFHFQNPTQYEASRIYIWAGPHVYSSLKQKQRIYGAD